MATTNYNLPTITGNMAADVVRDMNALAEATDGAIKSAVDSVDLSEVEQSVSALDKRVTAHLDEMASTTKLGHVKIGQSLTISSDGTLDTKEQDTGWITGTLEAGWKIYTGGFFEYRKVGNLVYIRGFIEKTTGGLVSTLPVGFRPPNQASLLVNNSGTGITVNSAGAMHSNSNMTIADFVSIFVAT